MNRYREIATELDPNWTNHAICCQTELAGNDISSENMKTIEGYAVLNFEAVSISSFQENQNQPFE